MQITIDCPQCDAAKRPLQACAACGAAGRPEDVAAWRQRLHAHHLSVILAEPRRDTLAGAGAAARGRCGSCCASTTSSRPPRR